MSTEAAYKEKTDKQDAKVAEEICAEFERRSTERGTQEQHWDEIARYMMPNAINSFTRGNIRQQGDKRMREIYDVTAVVNLSRFASIMDSFLTPASQTWHKLKATDQSLNKLKEVQLYLDEVNRILFAERYNPHAQFAGNNNMRWKFLGGFGTAGMLTLGYRKPNRVESGLRYKGCSPANLYPRENSQGMIDDNIRPFKLTAVQAAEEYGEESLPQEIKAKLQSTEANSFLFEFLHCVKPRRDWDPARIDHKGKVFGSYYVSVTGKKLVQEGGFDSFPYAISRHEHEENEVYGRSPAMDALPGVKTLNEQKRTMLRAGHKAVDPTLLVHDDGIIDGFSNRAGALNPGGVSADGRPLVHALPVGNLAIGKEMMEEERNANGDLFLTTVFKALIEHPNMTATQVMEIVKEKGVLVAPAMGRQQSEALEPQIERELEILAAQGKLPPMPDVLREAQGQYSIVHDSPLSRTQRSEEASGAMRTLEAAGNYYNLTQDPSVLDYLDVDTIMPAIAEINGVPPSWVRTAEQVNAIRAKRQQEKQAASIAQTGPATAAMISAAAKAKDSGLGGL